MRNLITMSLFSLLPDPIKDKDYQKKLDDAYVEFIEETILLSQIEEDIIPLIRNLESARIECITLQTFELCGKGGKCEKNSLENHPIHRIGIETSIFATEYT